MNEINNQVQKWLCAKVVLHESGSAKLVLFLIKSMTHTLMQMNEIKNTVQKWFSAKWFCETGSAQNWYCESGSVRKRYSRKLVQ